MERLRVLIVDDSAVTRRLVSDALSADGALEVVGTAPNGKIALDKIGQLRPNAVTLDVEMPVMDGLEALGEIRKRWPRLPVIMFSTLTERGAETTLDALSMGASDYVTKPTGLGRLEEGLEAIRASLIPKLRALCGMADVTHSAPTRPIVQSTIPLPSRHAPVKILAIRVSTGGPQALEKIVPLLPGNFAVPVVIVQHMPKIFTRFLADRLSSHSQIRVRECIPGSILRPGEAWIAPGDYHMTLKPLNDSILLETNQGPPENSCRPAVDALFRSVAQVYGKSTLALILTGMGSDGLRGCKAVREAGGQIFVQDEATSVVWGMPGAVAHAGLADKMIPLEEVSQEICRCVEMNRLPAPVIAKATDEEKPRALP
ncbi:MAG TPA: chemotaxis response regulator protein-glutamate methylesterase [Candidatus Acidoferrum sp.]|nr:chemotaxis response regulator protein-glutamate methylesterase [Candidatus Acidoferrum sp.]